MIRFAIKCSAILMPLASFPTWAPSSEFVSLSIPSWQISTAHVQPFRGARDLVFCLTVPLDSLLVWASSEGSGEAAGMRRLAWTIAARIGDKYQIRLAQSTYCLFFSIIIILQIQLHLLVWNLGTGQLWDIWNCVLAVPTFVMILYTRTDRSGQTI